MSDVTLFPTTADTDGSSGGDIDWTNKDNIYIIDAQYAVAKDINDNRTYYLKARGYGANIPETATIDGIEVVIVRQAELDDEKNSYVRDDTVSLLADDGTLTGKNKADTITNWPVINTKKKFGGATDKWGLTSGQLLDIINAELFGVALAVKGYAYEGHQYAYIDCIYITIYYTKAGVSKTQIIIID